MKLIPQPLSNRRVLPLLMVLTMIGFASMNSRAQTATPETPTDPWTQIDPRGDTICAKGEPYRFFVHTGTSNHLVIYFDGGGGCWNEATCGPRSNQVYTEAVTVTTDDLTTGYGGIFDFQNPENPFASDSMIFIPYCTADMHMGNTVMTYGSGDQTVEIHHNGFSNAQTALAWTYDHFDAPERVFVTGSSAGAPGSIFHAPFIMEHYAGVPVTQLGDSGGGWRGADGKQAELFKAWGTIPLLPAWVSGFQGMTPETLSFEQLYSAAAAQYPDNRFAQYNTAHDQTQNYFLGLMTPAVFYDSTLKANLADITAVSPNFFAYTAGGAEHGIIGGGRLYTYAINGLRFRDWLNDLVTGQPLESIKCTTCYKAEEISGAGN